MRNHSARLRHSVLLVGLLIVLVMLGALSGAPQVARAQEPIALDENKLGEISVSVPQPVYLFAAQANQQVEIEVLAIAQGLAPQFTIFNQSGALVQAVGNPTLTNSLVGVVTFPQAGTYSIQIASANGVQGQFVLTIRSATPVVPPTPLAENEPASGELAGGQNITYSFAANPNALLSLELTSTNSTQSVRAELKDQSGKTLALLGSELLGSTLILPPGSSGFTLELKNEAPTGEPIAYQVLLTPISLGAQTGGEAVQLPELPTGGGCVLATRSNTQVNVRANPAPDANIIAKISQFEIYTVVGRTSDSGWYRINYGGGEGWVSGSVVRTAGACSGVTVYTPAPTQPAPAATEGATQAATETATQAATEQATQQATETATQAATDQATQPASEAAPADNDYIVTLDRNSNAQFGERISYPDGDRSDGINFSVGNFDSVNTFVTYTFAMSCSGANAAALRWGIGNSGGLGCGGSTNINFTTDSNNTRIVVYLPDGSPAGLVNYTLTIVKQ